jgi:Trimethylamine:corrinoid methyltransferase
MTDSTARPVDTPSVTPPLEPIRSRHRVRFLDDEQLDRLQDATLRVLEDVGVRFPSDVALQILGDHGASVEDALDVVGPGGDFLARPATRRATHDGEWHLDRLGVRDPWDRWEAAGQPDIVGEAERTVADTLAAHQPLPMDEATTRHLAAFVDRAAGTTPSTHPRRTRT